MPTDDNTFSDDEMKNLFKEAVAHAHPEELEVNDPFATDADGNSPASEKIVGDAEGGGEGGSGEGGDGM
jgi:hypothetical protein